MFTARIHTRKNRVWSSDTDRCIREEEKPEYVGSLGAPERRLEQRARAVPIFRGHLATAPTALGRERHDGPSHQAPRPGTTLCAAAAAGEDQRPRCCTGSKGRSAEAGAGGDTTGRGAAEGGDGWRWRRHGRGFAAKREQGRDKRAVLGVAGGLTSQRGNAITWTVGRSRRAPCATAASGRQIRPATVLRVKLQCYPAGRPPNRVSWRARLLAPARRPANRARAGLVIGSLKLESDENRALIGATY